MPTPSPDPSAPPAPPSFRYEGDPAWRERITAALQQVVDPELALSIMDLGLVYELSLESTCLRVGMTMTSASCPMADLIVDDVHAALGRILPDETEIQVDLVWEPPWSPERMSDRARRLMTG